MDRKLAAILAADVVGYSRQMAADEARTMTHLRAMRAEVIDPLLADHRGRLFKTMGDGFLVEFASTVQALACAQAIQARMAGFDGLQLRIGLHTGDVLVEGDDLFGDGVNIAARLESLAEPGGICLSARVREDAAGKIILELEDLGTPALKNIDAPIQVFRVRLTAPERPALPLPEKPSLAVLPFQNMSGDPEQEYFADGVVEDIITALSRTGWLFVIARNSSFAYKGTSPDIRKVGRELGVRYVLEGSVRKAGGRVRITCQLIEAATGGHIWADRFEGDLADIFDLQDRITESVVGAMEPSLKRAEIARATAKPTERLDAYDLYLRALQLFYLQTQSSLDQAATLLRQALAIDSAYMRAAGLLASVQAWRNEFVSLDPRDRAEAITLARKTIAIATDDPDALRYAAWALSYLAADFPTAIAALNRAVRQHPNSAQTLWSLGSVYGQSNNPTLAPDCYERAMRLSPVDPELGHMLGGLGGAHLLAGRTSEAVGLLQRSIQEMPQITWPYRFLILAFVRLGQLDDAKMTATRLLEVNPSSSVGPGGSHLFNPAFNEERRQALLLAGIPE